MWRERISSLRAHTSGNRSTLAILRSSARAYEEVAACSCISERKGSLFSLNINRFQPPLNSKCCHRLKHSVVSKQQHGKAPSIIDGMKLIDVLSPKEGDKVLDIGCGTGELTRVLAERVGPEGKVVGVDPDKERVKFANKKYGTSNLEFLEGDSENFPENHYDIVYSNYVLQWVKDKDTTFKKVSQNMRPGGKFGFTHPASVAQVTTALSYTMGATKGRMILEKMHWFESPERYETLASSNGLVVTQKEIYDQSGEIPNIDVLFMLWYGVTHGAFDPKAAKEDEMEKFKQQYGTGPFNLALKIMLFTFTKP